MRLRVFSTNQSNMSLERLNKFFNPKTIAVIGASNNEHSVGYSMFKNIKDSAYQGTVYPVNIKDGVVQGVVAYRSVSKLPTPPELAIIATPAPTVLSIVEECGKAGVNGAIIISSGFLEADEKGKEMFLEIKRLSEKYSIKILGPNCLGYINPRFNLNASFAPKMPKNGKIAFISQSGALCNTFLDWSVNENIGFSYFVSIGSMADISFDELIDYFNTDPEVSSILIYMESLNSARRFMSSARAFTKTKPIIVLKAGVQDAGKKAVLSHTGTIAGDNAAFDAAFERAGIIRVETVGELFNYAKTLAHQKNPEGKRLAIVTNAGGPAVISTDYLTQKGGEIAHISQKTIAALSKTLSPAWSKNNPIDLLGDAKPEHYRDAVAACLNDEAVDAILIILTPKSVTQPRETAEKIAAIPGLDKKPVFASFMGADEVKDGIEILLQAGIPVYRTPEKAIICFLGLNSWKENLGLIHETPEAIPGSFTPDTDANRKLIDQAMAGGRFTITDNEAKIILENYAIPTNPAYLARNAEQLDGILRRTGFPVAMKIAAPGILHKTELGGVRLNIFSKNEAKEAFAEILRNFKNNSPQTTVDGVTVEKIVPKKYELIIGSKKDPLFGPIIIFGMGGVAVEVFKDIAAGLPPLNMALARHMIEKTKIFQLLKGYRNMEGVDIKAIQFVLYKFAYLVMDFPQIKEVDINPFGVDKDGGIVLDAKIVLDPEGATKIFKPYSHLAIVPHIKEYEKNITAGDGTKVFLRPIMAEDEYRHRDFINNLSEDSKKFRFFETIKNPDSEFVRRFTQIDYDREVGIIAEIEKEKGKETIAVARLIENVFDNTAEYAIVVADAWQNKGIGKKMTGHMIEIAKKKKFKKIYSSFLKENFAVKSLVQEAGFRIEERSDTFYAELDL